MPEAFCSHCGALRTSRTPVCSSCGGELDRAAVLVAPAPTPGIIARQPRPLLITLIAALLAAVAFLVFAFLG
jgi:predicted amidophosphoribosyltransferase